MAHGSSAETRDAERPQINGADPIEEQVGDKPPRGCGLRKPEVPVTEGIEDVRMNL